MDKQWHPKQLIEKNMRATAFILSISMLLLSCGHDETADIKPDFTLSADEIVGEFLDDAQAANAKFNDKVVQVNGAIMELNKTDGKITGVKISSDEFNIVNCTFQEPIDPQFLPENVITVKGVCSGFLGDSESMLPGGTVELKRSSLVK